MRLLIEKFLDSNTYKGLDHSTGEMYVKKEIFLKNRLTDEQVRCLQTEKKKYELTAVSQLVKIAESYQTQKTLLDHYAFPPIYSVCLTQSNLIVFEQFMSYGSLEDMLKKFGALPSQMIQKNVKELVTCLKYIVENSICCQQLRLSNVLFNSSAQLVIDDVGFIASCKVLLTKTPAATERELVHSLGNLILCM